MMKNNFQYKYIAMVVTLAFLLGAYLLEYFGIKYVTEGGSPVFKIHFYSYLILLGFGIYLLRYGVSGLAISLGEIVKQWFIATIFISVVIAYGLIKFGTSGMAYLVDAVLTPLLVIPILLMLSQEGKAKILNLLAWLVFINSLVALAEFAMQTRLIPIEYREFSFAFFRSAGFLSHPLNNALITASLAPMLMGVSRIPKMIYFSVVLLALFAFGGRAAMAIFILSSFVLNFNMIKSFVSEGVEMDKVRFAIYHALIFMSVILVISILVFTPIGDRILSKLFIDNSAQARFDVFIILEQLSVREWLFGANKTLLANIDFYIGITVIENYLVAWIVKYGVVATAGLMLSVYLIPFYLCLRGDLAMKVSLFNLFFIAISNNALVSKTPVLLFFNITLILYFMSKEKA